MNIADELEALNRAVARLQGIAKNAASKPEARTPSNRKKLTADDAARIRGMWSTGNYTLTELADEFDVHRSTIRRIVDGVYWKE